MEPTIRDKEIIKIKLTKRWYQDIGGTIDKNTKETLNKKIKDLGGK